jgi:hypothetical protein
VKRQAKSRWLINFLCDSPKIVSFARNEALERAPPSNREFFLGPHLPIDYATQPVTTVYVIALMTSRNCGVDVLCLRAVEPDSATYVTFAQFAKAIEKHGPRKGVVCLALIQAGRFPVSG